MASARRYHRLMPPSTAPSEIVLRRAHSMPVAPTRWGTTLFGALDALPAAAAIVAVGVAGVFMFETFFGDANIYLPFAQNASHGDFFSFNPHSFSSGATSPLWTLVLAIPFVLGIGVGGAKLFALLMTIAAVA